MRRGDQKMSADSAAKKQIPAVVGWFTMPPEDPHIKASKCTACGDVFFPPGGVCRNPRCAKDGAMEVVRLSRRGKLKTYTINHYPPPPPYHAADPFVPFGVGEVRLQEGINITGQIATGHEEGLEIGMEMEVVREILYVDDEGNDVLVYKFRPVT